MALLPCLKTTEKGLNHGCYGGSGFGQTVSNMANNWPFNGNRRQNKYQGAQGGVGGGYAMNTYGKTECYEKMEVRDEQGRYGSSHVSQNGTSNAMLKPKLTHGQGNGFGGNPSNGMAPQFQGYGSNNRAIPGKGDNLGYGYDGSNHGYGSNHGNKKHSGGVGHNCYNDHANYEVIEDYVYNEFQITDNSGNYGNNPMAPPNRAKLQTNYSGQGNGFPKPQAYSPGKNTRYQKTETETHFYENRYSDKSHFYADGGRGRSACNGGCSPGCNGVQCGGRTRNQGNHSVRGLLRKMKNGNSGDSSCSDGDSDNEEYGKRQVWISKAL